MTNYRRKASEDLTLLTEPDKDSKVICTVKKDAKFDVIDTFTYYAKINYNGNVGYVPKSKIQKFDTGGMLALLHKGELILNDR